MTDFSADEVWSLNEKEFAMRLNAGVFQSKSRKITFYNPSFAYHKQSLNNSSPGKFPTISITGTTCALKCKHCGGELLKTMQPAETPEKLFKLAERLKLEGAIGCLVSGGCLPNGSVPIDRFAPVLERMKHELDFTVNVHSGIIDLQTAKALKQAGVDAVLIDVVGSEATMKQVLNVDFTADYYEHSLNALKSTGLRFVPHVIVGLQNGKLDGELRALKMIRKFEPSALVIIAFMPIRNTEMEHADPPSPLAVARVVATARLMFPKTPLALGCMRPKGKHRAKTDILALNAGVDAIAFPSEEAVNFAEAQGFEPIFSPYCCSQIYADVGVRRA